MARPPLPLGTWGEIATWAVQTDDNGKVVKHKSQARFRDHDGRVRPVSAFGKTKTASERALLKKLQDRARTGKHAGELTAMHKINDLIDLYERKFKEAVADGRRSPTTLDNYQGALKNHIRPALGELRIGEALAVVWSQVDLEAGTVAITHTIARVKGEGLIRKNTKSRAGNRLLHLPLWAGSMIRTRHAAGIRFDDPIFADTLGGFRDPSNTRRALRTAKVDHQLIATLVATCGIKLDHHHALQAQLHDATQPTESDKLAWIRSHALRKTTATALDEAGHTARQIADQLGQAKVSITQDVYLGRRAANPAAAQALEQAFEDPDLL
ncbi:integrase [Kribbella aluminosa]|uniref:Integrase n=1 Tax=Kribbella aluminosa TaxID=416017 RepID=A0ABS4UJH2_9ACTN|nr:tyrosine-type recombinase/integrase [Kribbella aluminosa]MBP2351750.1 integrase [Kribbella aluminosa]